MSALGFFKEHCFTRLAENLRRAILEQISKDRDGELVNLEALKGCILIFVQMGFNNANIEKEEDEYVWRGDKNLHIYESDFEKFLIPRVSFLLFLNSIIVPRRVSEEIH